MKTLIAGFGNIFFRDDGYGCEAARFLARAGLPDGVTVRDFGISGLHVAFEMLAGYDRVILVDAVSRGGAPGTLYAIEPDGAQTNIPPDAHAMQLETVLSLYERLSKDLSADVLPTIAIVGCEPECVDEGMGLSPRVAAAVPATAALIHRLLEPSGGRTPV